MYLFCSGTHDVWVTGQKTVKLAGPASWRANNDEIGQRAYCGLARYLRDCRALACTLFRLLYCVKLNSKLRNLQSLSQKLFSLLFVTETFLP